jgi:hypothetical protein
LFWDLPFPSSAVEQFLVLLNDDRFSNPRWSSSQATAARLKALGGIVSLAGAAERRDHSGRAGWLYHRD